MTQFKVLRILHRPAVSGTAFHVANLTSSMTDEFNSLLVYGQLDKDEADATFIFNDAKIEHKLVKNMKRSINPFQDILALIELIRIIRSFKPHIVDTHSAKSGTLGRIAAKICRVPVIVHTFHGNVFDGYFNPLTTKIFILIERILAKFSDKIIAISESQKEELTQKYKIAKASKCAVVPLGLDLDRFKNGNFKDYRNIWKLGKNEFCICAVGRIAPIKNYSLFIDLITKLKFEADNIRVRGVLIGEGELQQELKNQAIKNGLKICAQDGLTDGYDVLFANNQKDIPSILKSMDIMVLTSNNEGTPVVLIEAQASGLPIIATDVGGISEITFPNENTLLSSKGSLDELFQNAQKMISNLNLYRENAENKSNEIIEKFSTETLIASTKNIYNSLLKEKGLVEDV